MWKSVAMEGTGTYWIPVHEVLEREKFEVVLVCTRDLAHVPGRLKTDRIDCKWLERLHACGLLRGSFRPPEQICMLRTLVRDKGNLIEERGDWLRRIQAQPRRRSAAISRKLRMFRAPGLIRQRAHCHRYHPSASGRIIIGAILSAHRMTVQQINALAA